MGKIPLTTISAFVDTKDGKTNPGQSQRQIVLSTKSV